MPNSLRAVWAVLGAVTVLGGMLVMDGSADAAARAQAGSGWCGSSVLADWVCRWHGSAYLGDDVLSSWKPRQLQGSTTVATATASSARLSLRNQARCTVGAGDRSSEVVTRPSAGVLLRQLSGASICGTPHRVKAELCTLTGCHTQLRTQGVVLARVLPEEAIISTTERLHHRIVIVSCSGFISVSAGGQFVSGSTQPGNRFVVEVDESTFFTTDETRTETPTEVSVEAHSEAGQEVKVVEIGELPGRGPCKVKVVQEEERELGGP